MAVWAKKSEIFSPIVISLTVNMINCQHQWFTIPNHFQPAHHTMEWNPNFNHRAAQLIGFFMLREGARKTSTSSAVALLGPPQCSAP